MMFESCGEVLTSGEMSVVYSNTTTTTRSESLTSYPSATNETHETNAQQLPFNLDHHSQCLTVPKVTFSSLGSFANKLVYTPLEQSDNGSSDNTSVNDKQNSHCEVKMSRFMNLARKFNCFYFNGELQFCRPFLIAGKQVGLIKPNVLEVVLQHPEVFCLDPASGNVSMHPLLTTYEERSVKIHNILSQWRDKSLFHTLKGWRNECYEVKAGFADPPLLKMERAATCLFGIRQYGVSLNGYTNHPEKGFCLWMQRRSCTKQTWPGKWDNIVSGGLSVGHSIFDTALKEADEEASIPPHLLANLKASGSVSIYFESERGIFPNTEFVYDLELPADFVPNNADGEVDSFELVPIDKVRERILSADYKTTSCPVALDFLIRHNFINSNNEPHLPELVELLHIPLHLIYNYSR